MIDSEDSRHPKHGTACCGHTVVIFTAVIVPKHGTTACKQPTQHCIACDMPPPKAWYDLSCHNTIVTITISYVMIDSDNSHHPKRGTACCGHTVVIFTAVIVPKHGQHSTVCLRHATTQSVVPHGVHTITVARQLLLQSYFTDLKVTSQSMV